MYGVAPTTHTTTLVAPDGTELFLETWLPAPKDGNVPPERLPTILVITPYVKQGTLESAPTMQTMVPRGYAYSQLHVRGTGESTGCIDIYGPTEAADGALAIEWVATKSPWGNGVVGGYGVSYPGGTILNAAGRGDPEKTQYLRAILAGAPAISLYEAAWTFDGVPSFLAPQLYLGQYMTLTSLPPGENTDLEHLLAQYLQKPECYPAHLLAALDLSGDFTPYYAAREGRDFVGNIRAPVFMFHGHADLVPLHGAPPILQVGLFDRLPATTPKFGIFGVFGHENPGGTRSGVRLDLRRSDFLAMEIAWFDHWLKGIDSGVDGWGTAQVQGTDGRWRLADDWPRDGGGPMQQLALSAGRLGGVPPGLLGGASTYIEGGVETTSGFLPGTSVVFDTGPLAQPLELTGQAVLDLWLQLALPDSHVAARLDAFDATGAPIPAGSTYALRSARHRQPLSDGRFTQAAGTPAPVLTPFRTELRFQPTDIVVPVGGRLRLTVAGSVIVNPGLNQLGIADPLFHGPSQPSGVVGPVRVLHSSRYPSALRFETASTDAVYIDPAPHG